MKKIFKILLMGLALITIGCQQLAIPPIDWPEDPVKPPVDSIVICDTLVNYNDPFVTLYTEKHVGGDTVIWLWNLPNAQHDTIQDIETFLLGIAGDNLNVYIDGIHKAIVIQGTDATTPFLGLVCLGADGTRSHFTAHKRGMTFLGALTFDEYMQELQNNPSGEYFTFCQTGFSCAEIEQVIDFLIDNCVDGTGVKWRINCVPCNFDEKYEILKQQNFKII